MLYRPLGSIAGQFEERIFVFERFLKGLLEVLFKGLKTLYKLTHGYRLNQILRSLI